MSVGLRIDDFSREEIHEFGKCGHLYFQNDPEHSWKITILTPIVVGTTALSVFSIYHGCTSGFITGLCAVISGLYIFIFCMNQFAGNGSNVSNDTTAFLYKTFIVLSLAGCLAGMVGSISSLHFPC